MAITIIGEDIWFKYRITCKRCAVILEYTEADTRVKNEMNYTEGLETYQVLDCPKCGNIIYT